MTDNHWKRWSPADQQYIERIASNLENKEDMYEIAPTLAKELGRSEKAVCKRIEDFRGWYWASKK